MNRKEIREIRKRFHPEMGNFSHIYGCYVNAAGEVVTTMDLPVMEMEQQEREMYIGILKKVLSGSLGRNLMEIEFATNDVGNSDEHRLLQALRFSNLRDENMRGLLYDRIRSSIVMPEQSYVILLAFDSYDIPYKDTDEEWSEESTDQFDYFVCCVCPVKDSKATLKYLNEEKSFRGTTPGSILSAPQVGFMYPSFTDRAANIYSVMFYSRSSSDIHEELVKSIFNAPIVPMAPAKQENAFGGALMDSLGAECSFDVVRALHNEIRERLVAYKESKDPEPPEIYLNEVDEVLMGSGVTDDRIAEFHDTCKKYFSDQTVLNPDNLINSKKFEIQTPVAKISVDPEQVYSIRTQVIDGREYLLIPVTEGVTVNGIELVSEANDD